MTKKAGTFCKNHDDGLASLRLFSVESRRIFYAVVSARHDLQRKILFQPIILANNLRVLTQKSQRNIDSVAAPHRKEGEDHERIPGKLLPAQ